MNNVGWECPRCKIINSPNIKKCSCLKTEETSTGNPQLLLE